jgi:hypothetical protein
MRKRFFGHIVLAFIALSCCNTSTSTLNNPLRPPKEDACHAACANLRAHACSEARPIDMNTECKDDSECKGPDGKQDVNQACAANGKCIVTCEAFCKATLEDGVWLDPVCVSKIWDCNEIQSCTDWSGGKSCTGPGCKVAPGGK